VVDPSIGHQYEAQRLPFSCLEYDPKDDVVIVGVGGHADRAAQWCGPLAVRAAAMG
jgi:hypothetical protein